MLPAPTLGLSCSPLPHLCRQEGLNLQELGAETTPLPLSSFCQCDEERNECRGIL